ncbi:MAG: hypothetical protein M3164_02255 [Actinomycetota bacterium]|nr:hypothetical protein [Actinomycetota bacterium]
MMQGIFASMVMKILTAVFGAAALATTGAVATDQLDVKDVKEAISDVAESIGLKDADAELPKVDAEVKADEEGVKTDLDTDATLPDAGEVADEVELPKAKDGKVGDVKLGGNSKSAAIHAVKEVVPPGPARGKAVCAVASEGRCVTGQAGGETENKSPGNSGNTPAAERRNSGQGSENGKGKGPGSENGENGGSS